MASDPMDNIDWRELLDALPDSEAAFLRRIEELLEADAPRAALDRLDAAISRHPTVRLRIAFGRLALTGSRFVQARRVLEPASRDEAAPVDAHLLLAEACLDSDAPDAARRALDRAARDGASGSRFTVLKRRVESAVSSSDSRDSPGGSGDRQSEESLNSTVDATLGDLIEASAEAGEFGEPGAPGDGLHSESHAGDDLGEEENPFADMEDTVFDDAAEPESYEGHERPADGPFDDPNSTLSEESAPDHMEAIGDADSSADQIGRSLDDADNEFYEDVEDTAFDASMSPPEPDPPIETGTDPTDEQNPPPTDDQHVPPSNPPEISSAGDGPDENLETEASDGDDDDEVFSITTSTDGSGVQLDEMLVEAPLDASDDLPEEDPTDIDALDTSEFIQEAEDDRDDIQMADPEPTQLIQLDDDATAEPPPGQDGESAGGDIVDPPTTPDIPSANDGRQSPRNSIPSADRDAPTEPEVLDDPPTTPDVPSASGGAASQGNPLEVPKEDEIPTDPRGPKQQQSSNRSGPDPGEPSRPSGNDAGRGRGDGSPAHDGRSSRGGRQQPSPPDRSGSNRGDPALSRSRPSGESGDGGQRRHPYSQKQDENTSNSGDQPRVNRPPDRLESGESRVTPPPRAKTGIIDKFRTYVDRWALPEWLNSRSAALLGVVTVATLTAALLFIGAATTWIDNNRLMSALKRIDREQAPDTYQGWRSGFETANRALGSEPGFIRSCLHSLGSLLPLTSPANLRRKLKAKRALFAAMLEYRYEAYGERRASELAESALTGTPALAGAADTYRLLAEGRHMSAVQRAKKAHHDHKGDGTVANAYLAALLETEQAGEILREASDLEAKASAPTVYERFLLARAARFQQETVAHVLFESLVQQHSPGHLDAQIERIHTLTERESYQEAKTLARQLLDETEATASSYQRARLHIALGETYQRMGEHARAEEQFRSAIKAKPTRTSVYLPLTDLFIDDGRLDKARQEVEAAEAKAQPSPPLQKRKAHLLFLRGRFDDALAHVDSSEDDAAYAPILEGQIRLESGDYQQAREIFNAVDTSHPRYPAAKSLELFTRTQMGVDDRETVLDELSSLLTDAPTSPLVLRTAARIRLYYARHTIGKEHYRHLDETFELLERAVEAQPDRSLNQYLMCRAHLIANDGSDAAMACRKAKRQNPEYLPGMLTVTRLYLRRGDLTKATAVLDRLDERFDDKWPIAKLRVRTLLQLHEIEEARALIDEWLQRPVADENEFHLFDGLIAFAEGDYPQALGHFEKAESDHSYEDEAALYRAHTLARLGELAEAESIINDDLTVHPRWRAAAWLVFAEIRRLQGREDDALENLGLAEKHFDSGLTPPGRLSHLFKERAFAVRDARGWNDDRVDDYLDEGKRLGDTESPEIQLGLGLYYLDGPDTNFERAATHLQKVVDLQPHRCEAVWALAETYRELRDRDGEREMEELARKHCDG